MKELLFSLSVVALLSTGCGNEKPAAPPADSTLPASTSEPALEDKQKKAMFIVDTYEDSMEIPHSKISVEYNDTRTFLGEITGAATVETNNNLDPEGIPKTAIQTCGGWYAGGGDYYYLVPTQTGVAVYHGWLDEGVDDAGYHWELMKSID